MNLPLQFRGHACDVFKPSSDDTDDDVVSRAFACRQLRLLREHLRRAFCPDDLHCEGENTFFFLNISPHESWLGNFTIEKFYKDPFVLLGRVGVGTCDISEALNDRLRHVNSYQTTGVYEYENGVLERRHRQLLTRDLTYDEVLQSVAVLCRLSSSARTVWKMHFKAETPHEFASRHKDVVWSRPQNCDLETEADEFWTRISRRYKN